LCSLACLQALRDSQDRVGLEVAGVALDQHDGRDVVRAPAVAHQQRAADGALQRRKAETPSRVKVQREVDAAVAHVAHA
jgi:hypothetical protein